jgi:hypothetical protein
MASLANHGSETTTFQTLVGLRDEAVVAIID